MRILPILAVGLLSCSAYADSIAYIVNKANGRIVITDQPCSDPSKGKIAYTGGDSETVFGCWFVDDLNVHIVWKDDNKLRSYPIENWTLVPKKTPGRGT
jgi:hypothetical protein